jgi:hypothetical protein
MVRQKKINKKKDYGKLFDQILVDIAESGLSWRKALKDKMSSQTFNKMLSEDEDRAKRYARATEQRAELLAEEMDDIATGFNDTDDNTKVQRDRLKIDTRKWYLSKLHPTKYGDRIEHAHTGNITLRFDKDDEKA